MLSSTIGGVGIRLVSRRGSLLLELSLKRGASPETSAAAAMAYLFRHTPLQITYPVNLTCLVPTDNPDVCAPMKADLQAILRHWLDFRRDTVRRRFEYELQKLRTRIHILEAFAKIFDVLDKIIAMIRASEGRRDAHEQLIEMFELALLQLLIYGLIVLYLDSRMLSESCARQDDIIMVVLRESVIAF